MRKVELLPTRDCQASYGPGSDQQLSVGEQIMISLLHSF